MNASSPSARGHHPHTPRRESTSNSQRPSTSSGDMVESSYLRDALMERRVMQQRARSATPRRMGIGLRQQTQKDEWLHSSDDESAMKPRYPVTRPARQRRASDVSFSRPPMAISRTLGARETESRIDKLEKESWDLKHRLTLFEERTKRLNEKIQEQENEIEELKVVEQQCKDMEQDMRLTQVQLDSAQEEIVELHNDNVELTQLNEELMQQLENREQELNSMERDALSRQSAIEEAAGIIQLLEQRLAKSEQMQKHPDSPPRTESDYYSGEPDPSRLVPTASKPPQTAHSAPDSDYFSADTSPLITPRSLKQVDIPAQSMPQLNAASHSSAAFNREVGLKSITSKDSLFSTYLDAPALPQPTAATSRLAKLRAYRRRAPSPKPKNEVATSTPESAKPKRVGKGWLMSNPLRNFYSGGEASSKSTPDAKERTKADAAARRQSMPYSTSADDVSGGKSTSNPSIVHVPIPVVVASPEKMAPVVARIKHVRSNSTNSRHNGGLMRHNSTPTGGHASPRSTRARHSLLLADVSIPVNEGVRLAIHSSRSTKSASPEPSSMTAADRRAHAKMYTTPPTQSDPSFVTGTKPTTQTHTAAATTAPGSSPNYAAWPKRYPAWPPSAGLANRGLLFHGEGMDEMFGGGPGDERDLH